MHKLHEIINVDNKRIQILIISVIALHLVLVYLIFVNK